MRQMYAPNVCGKCMRQMYTANVCGNPLRLMQSLGTLWKSRRRQRWALARPLAAAAADVSRGKQERGLVAWPRAVVCRFKAGGGDKPTYNPAPTQDFQRSLSFAAIRSSFDKMLVEMDQNSHFASPVLWIQAKIQYLFSLCRPLVYIDDLFNS